LASKHGRDELVKLLLFYKSDINAATTSYNSTSLHWAAQVGHEKVVKILMEAKCDTEIQEKNGDTAKTIATNIHTPSRDIILKMIQGQDYIDVEEKGSEDQSKVAELKNAVSEGKLQEFFDVNDVKVSLLSDVFLCKKVVQSRELLLLLIWSGGQVQKTDNTGFTALHWAARYANAENIQLIINAKADVNAIDTRGFNPLWYGKRFKGLKFSTLLKAGSNCNIILRNPLCNESQKIRIRREVLALTNDERVIPPEDTEGTTTDSSRLLRGLQR